MYLAIKAIHIISVIIWIGGLFLVTYVTAQTKITNDQIQRAIRVTEAAIGLTWLAGITLVILGGWHTSKWLYIKIFVVVLISAIHTFAHRRLKSESGEVGNPALPFFVLLFSIMVVFLVVFKRPM